MNCNCAEYPDLALEYGAIEDRIRSNKFILPNLTLLCEDSDCWHRLYACKHCGTTWQMSGSWSFGRKRYAFRVPEIDIKDWEVQPYVAPDTLFIYISSISDFLEENSWNEGNARCVVDSCASIAVKGLVMCKHHHIESLQRVSLICAPPKGRWFGPYNPTMLALY